MGILEGKLIENFQAVDATVDGFTDYHCINGWMRCTGYRLEADSSGELVKVIVVRLIFPADCIDAAVFEARLARANCIETTSGARAGRH